MIGMGLIRKSNKTRYSIVGVDGAGLYVIAPDEFGPPETVPLAVLAAGFNVKASDLRAPQSEAAVLRQRDNELNKRINQTYARALLEGEKEKPNSPADPPPGSPEAVFRKLENEQ